MLTRQRNRFGLQLAALLATSACLTACAGGPFPFGLQQAGPSAPVADAPPAPAPVAVAAIDAIDAPPPAVGAVPPADPLLVPAPGQAAPSGDGSQRVPLGALAGAPATGAPTSIMQAPAAKQAPPSPMPVPAARAAAPVVATPAPAPAPASPPVTQAAAEPPPAVVTPPPAQAPAKAPEKPRVRAETVRTSVMSTPQVIQVPAPDSSRRGSAPVLRPPLGRSGASLQIVPPREEPPAETVFISSETVPLAERGREFVPATVVPGQALQPNLIVGEVPMSGAERNIMQRFETLRRLQQEELITQDEYTRRRNVNIGALLAYTRDPGGAGLERSVPSGDVIVARLAALRRSFEMRAISASQHALERTMILNALLPETPEERADRKPPPKDVIDGAAMVGRLEGYRAKELITTAEFEAERDAIEYVLKNGLLPSQDMAAAKKTASAAKPTAAAKPKAAMPTSGEIDPLTREITGPVLHLASFRSEESARNAWTEALARNKTALASLYPIIRRVDLGAERGVFYRLMVGTFNSMNDAEAVCVQLKQNNQFCRASADGT